MRDDPTPAPTDHIPQLGIKTLVAHWFAACLFAFAVLVLVALFVHVAFPPTEPGGLFPTLRLAVLSGVGLIISAIAATVATLILRRRRERITPARWRRLWRNRVLLLLAACVLLGVVAVVIPYQRHARVTENIVGTWEVYSGDTLLAEETFRADGTAESRSRVGPEGERGPIEFGYRISPDGRFYVSHNPGESPPRRGDDGSIIWDWYITFDGPDRFVLRRDSWKDRAVYTYRRVN